MSCSGYRPLMQALMLLAALACHPRTTMAQDIPSEQSVRAAMVFNFLKFTDFPSDSLATSQQIKLCVAVADARQMEALVALSGRKIRGHEMSVTNFTAPDGDCDVLYVDSPQRWDAAQERHALRHVLTISAYPGFAQDGGILGIDVRSDGVRFDVNLAEGRRGGFRFSPQMLLLARKVYE